MADYKGKFTGQQVDDTLQQAIDDHKKVSALELKVNDLQQGGVTGITAITAEKYQQMKNESADFSGKVFVVYKGEAQEPETPENPDVPETPEEPQPTYYTITKNLSNCSISNNATTIVQGSNYSATITPNDGYNLDVVTCTMGGSSVSVVDGVISIPSVSGNIVINASASVVVPTPSFVEFNDDLAKSIAVSHWDTDGDGEISKSEASAVENLGGTTNSYFTGTAITNVDWVSQFSGLKTLWGAFKNCTSLEYVNIESSAPIAVNYSTRNTEIFNGCTSLVEARLCLTDNHADRFVNVFGGCTKLKKVDLSGFRFNNVTSLYMPFYNCSSLEEIDLSGADFTNFNNLINTYISQGNDAAWVGALAADAFTNCNKLSTIKMNGCNEASIQCIERIIEKTAPSARLSSITITNNGVNHTYNGSSWT